MTLAEARRRKGLMLKEVGAKMFLCEASIQQRESGRSYITEEELKVFCKLYGCKKEELDLIPVTRYLAAPGRRKVRKE